MTDPGGFAREPLRSRALHGYIYGRWPLRYVESAAGLLKLRPPAFLGRWFADRYHARVLVHDHARAIVSLDHDVFAPDQEQIIPFPIARTSF